MLTKRLLFDISLAAVAFVIWRLLYNAQFEEYDDNIASIILAFFISVVASVALLRNWFGVKRLVRHAKAETILFLVAASPLTVGLSIVYYVDLFGRHLKN